jgi:hypothetical protein
LVAAVLGADVLFTIGSACTVDSGPYLDPPKEVGVELPFKRSSSISLTIYAGEYLIYAAIWLALLTRSTDRCSMVLCDWSAFLAATAPTTVTVMTTTTRNDANDNTPCRAGGRCPDEYTTMRKENNDSCKDRL